MTHEVIIDGDRYIKAPPSVPVESTLVIEAVLAAEVNYEHGKGTVRSYLHDLLKAIWDEEEGFSGKRPFGNSGWTWDLYHALVRAGIIEGEIDEDGDIKFVTVEQRKKADPLIAQAIDYIFFGTNNDNL